MKAIIDFIKAVVFYTLTCDGIGFYYQAFTTPYARTPFVFEKEYVIIGIAWTIGFYIVNYITARYDKRTV